MYQSSSLINFCFFWGGQVGQGLLVYCPDWPQMCYAAQAGLELTSLLLQPLKYYEYKNELSLPASVNFKDVKTKVGRINLSYKKVIKNFQC